MKQRYRTFHGQAAVAEFLGTCIVTMVVIGSGIMAMELSPQDVGLQLMENTVATVFALFVVIHIFGPISGAHFNPLVTLLTFIKERWEVSRVGIYLLAQFIGAVTGVLIAHAMFGHALFDISQKSRSGTHRMIGEIVATTGLLLVIGIYSKIRTETSIAILVAAWIGTGYLATSSTSFANPAITIARQFSNTFAGIAPRSVPLFLIGQIVGFAVALLLIKVFQHEETSK